MFGQELALALKHTANLLEDGGNEGASVRAIAVDYVAHEGGCRVLAGDTSWLGVSG